MHERIIEIIVFVMSALKVSKKTLPEIDFKTLENMGYSQSEITAALSWIVSGAEYRDKFSVVNAPKAENPLRIMIDDERDIFTMEAISELNNYVNLGIITYEQMELIIERLTVVGVSKVTPDLLKSIIASLVFSQNLNNPESMSLILSGNDSVN